MFVVVVVVLPICANCVRKYTYDSRQGRGRERVRGGRLCCTVGRCNQKAVKYANYISLMKNALLLHCLEDTSVAAIE